MNKLFIGAHRVVAEGFPGEHRSKTFYGICDIRIIAKQAQETLKHTSCDK